MKTCKIILLTVFLLFCQNVFAQTVKSSITIKINGDKYIVSGVVSSDSVKNEIIEKVKTQLGSNAEFSKIRVQTDAAPFQAYWQTNFDESIAKVKEWKSGVLIFGDDQTQLRPGYPPLPKELANAQIVLLDGQTVSPKDYNNKLVVLFLFATWSQPAIKQMDELNDFYKTASWRNVEVIGIDIDEDPDEKTNLPKFAEKRNLQFTLGFMKPESFNDFVKISKLNGIPQAFVIFNGKLRGVFTGGATQTTEKLKETILKILDENNL